MQVTGEVETLMSCLVVKIWDFASEFQVHKILNDVNSFRVGPYRICFSFNFSGSLGGVDFLKISRVACNLS